MKKMISAMMLVVALMMVAPVNAQLIKFGVKGGVNLSTVDWGGGYKGNKDNSSGFFIGPMAEATIPLLGLGVEGALMYSQRGKDALKQEGIEVPVSLKWSFGLGSTLGFYLAAGPDFFFNFKDYEPWKGDSSSDVPVSYTDGEAKKAQVAINLGAGIKLLRKLQIGANYQIPVSEAYQIGDQKVKMKGWQISLAYIF